jgi:putative membrane protein
MAHTLIFAAVLLASSAAIAAPAAKFMKDAIQGDNSETRLGQLIAARGNSPAVRNFGSTLVRDHTRARAEAATVARRMHLSVPGSMMPEANAEYAKLQHLRGQSFDREVRRYMIEDHEKDISEFEQQARTGDRQTAALARMQLPTLHKHLSMAQSLSR